MEFHNVNPLNVRANAISGNLFPMTADDSQSSLAWRIYSVFVKLLQVIQIVSLITGMAMVPKEKAIQDGTIATVVTVETFIMISRIYARRKLMSDVVRHLNDVMRNADETMTSTVKSIMNSIVTPFLFYGITGVISVGVWTVQPIILILDRSTFYYMDYNLPIAFTSEPFSSCVFVLSTVFVTICSMYLFLIKFGVDVYMMHVVLLTTAQYRYISKKLVILFHDLEQDKRREVDWSGRNRWMEKELKALCRHQNAVMRISFMLKKLLSLNFSLIYMSSVFRFCFIGILLSAVPSLTFLEGLSVVLFTCGALTQFYMLCASVQTLSDASTEMTDKAFHEDWYKFGSSVKHTFMLMIIGNKLECKLATFENFNLSLPSFMKIMNQSYTIAVLFLKAK